MEGVLANVAVYNIKDFIHCIFHFKSDLFLVSITLLCLCGGLWFIFSVASCRRPVVHKNVGNEIEYAKRMVSKWMKMYDFSVKSLVSLWITPVNEIIKKTHESEFFSIDSILNNPAASVEVVKYSAGATEKTHQMLFGCKTKIPLLNIGFQLHVPGVMNSHFPLILRDVYGMITITLSHHDEELIDLSMEMSFIQQPTVDVDTRNFCYQQLGSMIVSSVSEAKVKWVAMAGKSGSELLRDLTSISSDTSNALLKAGQLSCTNERLARNIDNGTASTNGRVADGNTLATSNSCLFRKYPLRLSTSVNDNSILGFTVPHDQRCNSDVSILSPIFTKDTKAIPIKLVDTFSFGATDSSIVSPSPSVLTRITHTEPTIFRQVSDPQPLSTPVSTPSTAANEDTNTPVVLSHNPILHHSIMTSASNCYPSRYTLVRSASLYGELGQDETVANSYLSKLPQSASDDENEDLRNCSYSAKSRDEFQARSFACKPYTETFYWKNRMTESLVPTSSSAFTAGNGDVLHSSIFSNKKLLVKVMKAEHLLLKGTSNAYCVVELDEPYQRHSTHCSSAGQLFWDQHLLFDLNRNSKRVALEVFELSKRKRSVSKGRAELMLMTLATNTTVTSTDSSTTGGLHRLHLTDRAGRGDRYPYCHRHHRCQSISPSDSSNLNTTILGTIDSTVDDLSASVNTCMQAFITAEFHFMERVGDDQLTPGKRRLVNPVVSSTSSALPSAHRMCSTQILQESISAQDSPVLSSPGQNAHLTLSQSTSFEFSDTQVEGVTEQELASLTSDTGLHDQVNTARRDVQIGQLLSPVPLRRARVESEHQQSVRDTESRLPSISSASPVASPRPLSPHPFTPRVHKFAWPPSDPHLLESIHSVDDGDTASNSLQTNQFGFAGTTSDEHILSTSPMSPISQKVFSTPASVDASRDLRPPACRKEISAFKTPIPPPSRSQSLVSRLKSSSTRLLTGGNLPTAVTGTTANSNLGGSGLVGGAGVGGWHRKRSSEDSNSSLALLGPSQQLAGVAASLSALANLNNDTEAPGGCSTSPDSAAALASAVAVAGATGTWQKTVSGNPPGADLGSRTPLMKLEGETVECTAGDHHHPPVHCLPPAASVAAESPGTFTALAPPARLETQYLGLFRLFRHKKKRVRSIGVEKLMYLENSDLDDFDAISMEGYRRIVQDSNNPSLQNR